MFGTAHNLGWPSTQTGQVYWLYNDSVHLCFKDCHPRSLYNLWCVGVGSSQQLLGALSSSLLRLQCCDGVAAHMPPPPDVFVLPHSFTGCHGHRLQGEQLTPAFVVSLNTTCIPRISLGSISRQCKAERPTFALSCHAQWFA